MSTTLAFGPVSVTWPWTYQSVVSPQNVPANGPWQFSDTGLAQGTGAGQADTLYYAQTVITASGTSNINLSAVTNAFGTSVAFARLKAMYFENNKATASTGLAIGGAVSNPFTGGFFNAGTDTVTLKNAMSMTVGTAQDSTGYAVSTGVNILLTNSDGSHSCTANIGLVGCSV